MSIMLMKTPQKSSADVNQNFIMTAHGSEKRSMAKIFEKLFVRTIKDIEYEKEKKEIEHVGKLIIINIRENN
jgi:hypothetical protein